MQSPTLTFRQELFVFEYLKDQNASAAAGRAGYTAKNLASQGNELMSNPAIRDRVRLEMQNLLAEVRCSALELMKQRMRVAFFRYRQDVRAGLDLVAAGGDGCRDAAVAGGQYRDAQERAGDAGEAAGPAKGATGAGTGA